MTAERQVSKIDLKNGTVIIVAEWENMILQISQKDLESIASGEKPLDTIHPNIYRQLLRDLLKED